MAEGFDVVLVVADASIRRDVRQPFQGLTGR
jgi:hypothetical protein